MIQWLITFEMLAAPVSLVGDCCLCHRFDFRLSTIFECWLTFSMSPTPRSNDSENPVNLSKLTLSDPDRPRSELLGRRVSNSAFSDYEDEIHLGFMREAIKMVGTWWPSCHMADKTIRPKRHSQSKRYQSVAYLSTMAKLLLEVAMQRMRHSMVLHMQS